MRARRIVCAAALLVISWAVPALAQPAPPGPPPQGGPGGGPRMEHALERVELPDEVRARVDRLLDTSHANHRELSRGLRRAHDRMRELLEEAEPSEDAILGQADEIGRIQTQLEKDRLRTLLRIRAELTPEQREAMTQALRAERPNRPERREPRERRERPGGPGRGGPPGGPPPRH